METLIRSQVSHGALTILKLMNSRGDFFVTECYRRYYADCRSPVEVRECSLPIEEDADGMEVQETEVRRRTEGARKRTTGRQVAVTYRRDNGWRRSPCRRCRRRPCVGLRFSSPPNGRVVSLVVVSGRQYPRLGSSSNADSSHIRPSVPRRFLPVSDVIRCILRNRDWRCGAIGSI